MIGLPEPECEDSIDRADTDTASVVAMLRALKVEARPDRVYRMGRRDNNNSNNGNNNNTVKRGPRLVKVVMPSSFHQRQTLASLRNNRPALRKLTGFNRAIVRPSLSAEELVKDRELRSKLKKARELNPNVRLFIRNGEIVADGGQSFNLN